MKLQNLNEDDYTILKQYGLSGNELQSCKAVCYAAEETVLHQGISMDDLYVVTDGTAIVQIQAESGKTLTVCKCTAGDILGDLEFMTDCAVATTTVLAESCLRCVKIHLSENAAVLKNSIAFLNQIGRKLAEKLLNRGNAQTITALAPAKIRLCDYILQMEINGLFREPLTETARMLGISYRHIFRLLLALCEDGILERTQSGYRILNPEMLENIIKQNH